MSKKKSDIRNQISEVEQTLEIPSEPTPLENEASDLRPQTSEEAVESEELKVNSEECEGETLNPELFTLSTELTEEEKQVKELIARARKAGLSDSEIEKFETPENLAAHLDKLDAKPTTIKFTLDFDEIRSRHVRRADFDEVQLAKKISDDGIKNIEKIEIVRHMASVKGVLKTDVTVYIRN